jgi:mannose-6-phosphate isomerase-like protein (cupin superfamily)
MVIRNWRDSVPSVGHASKIIWSILSRADSEPAENGPAACLQGLHSLTRHVVQGRTTTDYHEHEGKEQIYYFISGKARMRIDGEIHPVTAGDAVHLPPCCRHGVINEGEDDVEYLNITARVPEE